ncbi:hypothetical protein [Corynebacterium lowii]|nr:hypothetical protein [Corynebacterium lowii]
MLAQIGMALRRSLRPSINGSFSAVPGLDQMGNYHGVALMGGPGSANSVLSSYAEQVTWLKDALNASVRAITEQNEAFARSLDGADEGAVASIGAVTFPPRPAPRYEPFVFPLPVVSPSASLAQLSAAFGATQVAQPVQAAASWGKMAASIGAVAAGLAAIAADLRVHNYGDVVDSAIKQIVDVADTGKAFARNAALMVTATTNLGPAQQQGAQLVANMQNALNAIPEPQERQAAEAAFLQAFPAAYTPMLLPGVPVVKSLTDPSLSLSLGSLIPTGMGVVAGKGHKHDASGLRPEGETALRRIIHAAQRVGEEKGATFQEVLSRTEELTGVQAESVGTVSAAAATADSPPVASTPVVPGGSTPASTSAAPAGSPAAGIHPVSSGAPANTSMAPLASGMPGTMNSSPGSAQQRLTGAVLPRHTQAGTSPVLGADEVSTHSSSWSGQSMPLLGGMGLTAQSMPASASASHHASMASGQSVGGIGGFGGALAPGTTLGAASGGAANSVPAGSSWRSGPGGPVTAASGGATSGARSHTFMGPMAGAGTGTGGGGARNKKIKTITSSVEENENLRALLGDRPPVVPGVIGHWARG